MDGMNVGRIISGTGINPDLYIKKLKEAEVNQGGNSFNSAFAQAKPDAAQTLTNIAILTNQLQMNALANMDRSVYIKNLLGLPQNLAALLKMAVGDTPINTLLMNNEAVKNQKVLQELFDEMSEFDSAKIQNLVNQQNAQNTKDAAVLLFNGLINMSAVSELILKNSKQAVNQLVLAMASASKSGMTNEQISQTLGVINSCIALAESGDTAQTLKSLMLLYLPWLPLNEGVGFDLEVETEKGEEEKNNSKLTVLIQTKNYGNVKGVFTLTTTNSVDVLITCSEIFPKTLLLQLLKEESSAHAMTTTIDIEAVEPKKEEIKENQETKVNLSATNEMNPYLLLMAHAFIRNTIYLDSNAIIEENSEKTEENNK